MTNSEKWDRIYRQRTGRPEAAWVLRENQHLLPAQGQALDLACGRGGNALLLAQKGLQVRAWDYSAVAVEQLRKHAAQEGLTVEAQVRDVIQFPPEHQSVDVLVVSFFLHRPLCPALVAAVKPGGLIFYQTYCQQKVNEEGPTNPAYLLKDNELLHLFATMKVRCYREDALLGCTEAGLRDQAMLVAEKPMADAP